MMPLTSSKRHGNQLTSPYKSNPNLTAAGTSTGETSQEPIIKRLCRDFSKLKSPSKPEAGSFVRYSSSAGDIPLENDAPFKIPVVAAYSGIKNSTVSPADVSSLPLYTVESVERKASTIELCILSATGASADYRYCSLRGYWCLTPVARGDKVVIIGTFNDQGTVVIDDAQNFLILHPDTLISPTLIGGTTYCARKAMLQEMIRSKTTMEMFIGTLVHDLMQRIAVAISKVAKSNGRLAETSQEVLLHLLRDPRYRQDMYVLNVTEEKVLEIASSFLPNIEKWAWTEFRKAGVDIADIEEWIWSPRFGVKGRVDMTLRTPTGIKPLEIKTGKASYALSHTGQVLLYTLLLSEKYNVDISEGVLYYAKTGDFKTISAKHSELRGLIQMRNDISNYLKRCHFVDEKAIMNIPGPINNERACSMCQLSTVCALFYKTVEEPRGIRKMDSEHYVHTLVAGKIGHLQQLHLDYFEKWMIMLYLEVHNSQKNVSVLDLWLKKGIEAGKPEFGVGGLRLKETKVTVHQQLCFCLDSTESSTVALSASDLILLREDNEDGLVIDLCTINSIEKEPILRMELQADRFFQSTRLNGRTLRVDKYLYSASSMAGSYDSLMKIMESGEKSDRMRRLFLQKEKPQLATQVPKQKLVNAKDLIKPLPKSHQTAVVKCLISLDYVFVDSKDCSDTPAFVSSLLAIFRKDDQSILLVSSNGATLDNIIRPLRDNPLNRILRLGPAARTHVDLKDLCPESLAAEGSFDTFFSSLRNANIVATTNATHRQTGLMHREFDVCVVTEASLMLQPSIFGFLFLAKRFVFIGDSEKKPNCRCETARAMGLDESLMAALHDTAVRGVSWVAL